jgi:CubicO group peptidase (beta-lactamase class C family)
MDRTTGYASTMYGDPNAAWPMEWTPQGFRRADQIKSDATMHAAGGMGTSARDAARWVMVHLGGGAIGDARVLSERSAREMLTPQSRFPQTRGSIRAMEGFGLGWQMGTYRGLTPYFAHGGGYVGTAAHLSFLPEKGVGVVVLANSSPGGSALCDIVSIDIYDAILGVDDEDLLPAYIKDIAAHHDQRAAAPADARARAGDLPRPLASYTGTYEHPHFGTVVVWAEQDTLMARMGTMAIEVFSTPNGDGLRGVSAMGPIDSIAFDFATDDRARAVELVADAESMRFERRTGS